mgnify:CR=1 FL=1
MEGCWACAVRCKKVVRFEGPAAFDPRYGGPEYETLAALGSNCGWELATVQEIVALGRRAIAMGRAFNLREGFTSGDDWLPKRFFSPPNRGFLRESGHAVDPEALRRGIRAYYYYQGWDPASGIPTRETLEALGLPWVADELASRGLERSAVEP